MTEANGGRGEAPFVEKAEWDWRNAGKEEGGGRGNFMHAYVQGRTRNFHADVGIRG